MPESPVAVAESKEAIEKQEFKDRFFKGVSLSGFLAVLAHTINLQTETIVLTRACGGDLSRTSRLLANSNAAAAILGLVTNNFGGKLSDALGRKAFFFFGPLAQMIMGLLVFAKPNNAILLVVLKAFRRVCTTFSGTIIGSAGMRDVFDAPSGELMNKELTLRTRIGLSIMLGPLLEGMILKNVKAGQERITYLLLSGLGAFTCVSLAQVLPESLPKAKRVPFDASTAVQAANPFAFTKIYTKGSAAFQKLATIVTLQQMIDGTTMSDTTQIWLREHLKLGFASIASFMLGYGLLAALSGNLVTKPLSNKLSVWMFTTLTNCTNLVAFSLRGLKASPALFFSMLPLMLPGVNGNSTIALMPFVSELAVSSGFGRAEASAYLSNLRAVGGSMATLAYGYFYAWCRRSNINPGHTFALAGFLGAGLPQLLLMSLVKKEDIEFQTGK